MAIFAEDTENGCIKRTGKRRTVTYYIITPKTDKPCSAVSTRAELLILSVLFC